MTASTPSADEIAQFLKTHPDFFMDHAAVFSTLRIPHPQQANTISLAERQIMILREQLDALQWQLSGLVDNAAGNQRISEMLIAWCAKLLAEDSPQHLPERITQGLALLFELPDIALQLWSLSRLDTLCTAQEPLEEDLQRKLADMTTPWCGSADDVIDERVLSWLPSTPASLALIPLALGTPPQSIGVLVLGSPDATRFSDDMGTEFLQTIATLAAAALARLDAPDQPHHA